jgi:hypothetical protein
MRKNVGNLIQQEVIRMIREKSATITEPEGLRSVLGEFIKMKTVADRKGTLATVEKRRILEQVQKEFVGGPVGLLLDRIIETDLS